MTIEHFPYEASLLRKRACYIFPESIHGKNGEVWHPLDVQGTRVVQEMVRHIPCVNFTRIMGRELWENFSQ